MNLGFMAERTDSWPLYFTASLHTFHTNCSLSITNIIHDLRRSARSEWEQFLSEKMNRVKVLYSISFSVSPGQGPWLRLEKKHEESSQPKDCLGAVVSNSSRQGPPDASRLHVPNVCLQLTDPQVLS